MGNLADLGLGDIFQIVAMSQRSGTLQLSSPDEICEVVFVSGRVVAVERAAHVQRCVGDSLVASGVLAPAQLQAMQEAEATGTVGEALFQQLPDSVPWRGALEGQVMRAVGQLFDWPEGAFSFVVGRENDPWRGFRLAGTRVVALQGINSQFLAIEGARLRDEARDEAPVASGAGGDPEQDWSGVGDGPAPTATKNILVLASAAVEAPPRAGADLQLPTAIVAKGTQRTLLLVDDDPDFLAHLLAAMRPWAGTVTALSSVADVLALVPKMPQDPIVATNLILPRADGQGILGGLQILAVVRRLRPLAPLILFSDYRNEEAVAQATALGVAAQLEKPRKAQIYGDGRGGPQQASPAVAAFIGRLQITLAGLVATPSLPVPMPGLPVLRLVETLPGLLGLGPGAAVPDDSVDLRQDMERALADVQLADLELQPSSQEADPEHDHLGGMLTELRHPASRDSVALLILRYASTFCERGALFLATQQLYIGFGGFCQGEASERFVARVRRLRLPIASDSIFMQVTRQRSMVRRPLEPNPTHQFLFDGLGSAWHAHDTVAVPLISSDRVAAILFADNPSGRRMHSPWALEIFLQQAGLVMDRAVLERQLEARSRTP